MSSLRIKADKKDYLRALLTDTLPRETPIIFSNDGLYRNLKQNKDTSSNEIVNALFEYGEDTKPYVYKINKSADALRALSLIHPVSQLHYAQFYKHNADTILYYCKASRTSIRAPYKVANRYYIKGFSDTLNNYRSNKIDSLADDLLGKYSNSYFAYKGFRKKYEFFESVSYLALEKKYYYLVMTDLSKCFDSIYTHSLGWGLTSKEFSKKTRGKHSFANEMDLVMQKSNYNETSGIPIGSEFSRIFSELLLVSIDEAVLNKLEKYDFYHNHHFAIRRYVDDYFIFSTDLKTQKMVLDVLIDELSSYKLSTNSKKDVFCERPFYTPKSTAMHKISDVLNDFSKKFTRLREEVLQDLKIDVSNVKQLQEGVKSLYPARIKNKANLIKDFIHRVQSICSDYELKYEDVSHYIISALFKRLTSIIEGYKDKYVTLSSSKYRSAIEVIVESSFYFFCLAPTVSGSFSISKIVVLSLRFAKKEIPDHYNSLAQTVYNECVAMLKLNYLNSPEYIESHLSLEKINIILSMVELGDELKLPNSFIRKNLLSGEDKLGYFEIIALLYYIQNLDEYRDLKKMIEKNIKRKLNSIIDVSSDSEAAHLFLDMISCPVISKELRGKLLVRFREKNNLQTLSSEQIDEEVRYFEENYWFVNWKSMDIYNVIEKKELQFGY